MNSTVHDRGEVLSRDLCWHSENKSLVIPNVSRIYRQSFAVCTVQSLWHEFKVKMKLKNFYSLGSTHVNPVMYPGILAETVFYCKILKPP